MARNPYINDFFECYASEIYLNFFTDVFLFLFKSLSLKKVEILPVELIWKINTKFWKSEIKI